jgi:Holliday junction DNA helicase RuvA
MIAHVRGTVEQVGDQNAVLEAGGIGYLIHASAATLSRLPRRGETARLFTYMQVTDTGVSLHGFLTQEELNIFRMLIAVSGIGPKVATSVLATLNPEQIVIAIVSGDDVAFSKAPGVGKKTAQRILLELRDKIKSLSIIGASEEGVGKGVPLAAVLSTSEKQDAADALLALGYGRGEAMRAVLEVAQEDMKTEQIVRLSLKKLMLPYKMSLRA